MNGAPAGATGAGAASRTADFVRYWLPAVLYVGLIFSVSSIRGRDLPPLIPNMDKVGHLLEYSLLGLLLGRAIRFTLQGRSRARAVMATIALGAVIGALDEIYQRRIPGRSSDVFDWIVDVAAVTLGALVTQWVSTRALGRRAGGEAREGGA